MAAVLSPGGPSTPVTHALNDVKGGGELWIFRPLGQNRSGEVALVPLLTPVAGSDVGQPHACAANGVLQTSRAAPSKADCRALHREVGEGANPGR